MNISSIAMSLLTPAVVARIATALGINPSVAQMAINAALPAILAALARKATHPAGLAALTDVLGQQSSGTLSHLGELIGGSSQSSLVNAGNNALGALFGGPTTNALAGAVGKFAGVPAAASTGLLGMLAPVALGTIAQQQQAAGLDGKGLASLLAGQQDNIAAALPAGFADLLKGTGLLDGAMPAADMPVMAPPAAMAASATAATAVTDSLKAAATAAGASATASIDAVKAAAAMPGKLPGVAAMSSAASEALKAAAAPVTHATAPSVEARAGATMDAAERRIAPVATTPLPTTGTMASATKTMPEMARPAPASVSQTPVIRAATERIGDDSPSRGGMMRWLLPLVALLVLGAAGWYVFANGRPGMPATNAILYNNVDVGSKAQALYERLKTTISGIKDDASATASLPRLRDADAELGDFRDMARAMPENTRKSLSGLFASLAPGLQGLVESAIRAAGPDSAAKPVLEQVLRRMKALAEG